MNTLSIICLTISVLTLTLAILRDYYNNKREQSNAIIKYLNEGDSKEFKDLRKELYIRELELKDNNFQKEIINCYGNRAIPINEENKEYFDLEITITKLISFYDKWALLYNKKYLPKWAIAGPREKTFLDICSILMFYIEFRRKQPQGDFYADDLLKLYNTKKKKVKTNQ